MHSPVRRPVVGGAGLLSACFHLVFELFELPGQTIQISLQEQHHLVELLHGAFAVGQADFQLVEPRFVVGHGRQW